MKQTKDKMRTSLPLITLLALGFACFFVPLGVPEAAAKGIVPADVA